MAPWNGSTSSAYPANVHSKKFSDCELYSFDAEGFSVWRVDFKYNEELTQTFMSSNQVGGFFNRLEASRKYLFGSVGVLGETNNSVISGALIARGQDIKPVVDVAPDFESYIYKRLDLNNADDKAFFEAALAWDLEIDGKKWADGKNVSLHIICGCRSARLIVLLLNSSSKHAWLFWLGSARCIIYPHCVIVLLVSLLWGSCCAVAVSRNAKRIVKCTLFRWCAWPVFKTVKRDSMLFQFFVLANVHCQGIMDVNDGVVSISCSSSILQDVCERRT